MEITYLLSIIAFDSIVIIFSVLFGAIPGKWYKWRVERIQLNFSIISFLAWITSCIWTKVNENQLKSVNSLFTLSFQVSFGVLYVIVLLASVYRFSSIKRGVPKQYIKLKSSEYKITNKFEYTLGNLIYMPNVKAYAIAKDVTIVFSGSRPTVEIDAGFICKKIGDKTYECLSFIDLQKEYTVRKIVNTIINSLIIIVALMTPAFVAYMDKIFINTGNIDNLYNIFDFIVLFLLGSLGCKLFSELKGFGKALYFLFLGMTIISFYYLVIYFK